MGVDEGGRRVGVGPWPGGEDAWPRDDSGRVAAPYDPDLLAGGDTRNVADRYRYWLHGAIVAVDNVEGAVPLETYPLPRACLLVFGQEGPGLSADLLEGADAVLAIAQFGSTRSLNAGAAAAIAMHAWVRAHAFGQRL